MLRTGIQYLDGIRDGRIVYVGKERVEDVTAHPAFANAAGMYAAMYDLKCAPEMRDILTFEDAGERYSAYFLKPCNGADLQRRTDAHRAIAAFSHGLLGRSPDHVASSITGLAIGADVFDRDGADFSRNIVTYHRHARDNDLFLAYAVLPPQGARKPELYQSADRSPPTLRVTGEDDDGVVLNGMKMLATGAVFADELWIGNIIPLAPSQVKESITCAVPVNAPGVSLWARKPLTADGGIEFNNPLAHRYDESDSMVVFKDVWVPWERVFVHDNTALSRDIYMETPAHCMANHQSNVRFAAKLRLLMGIASKITKGNGADQIPAVREILGELVSMEATFAGLIDGQLHALEQTANGHVHVNRRYMYAAVNYAVEHYGKICDQIRTLMGGGVFQMPASIEVIQDEDLARDFETYWSTGEITAVERMKLVRLAWDMLGSEFAMRHDQYEKFYFGQRFVVRNFNYIHAPWDEFEGSVDGIMASYDAPGQEPG
jgi:4-hydroxyphenylacetate 3-monooxygenase